jgi:hypothetical protein
MNTYHERMRIYMIIVSEQKEGITSVVRIVHNSIGIGKLNKEKIRCIEEFGQCERVKEVEDGIRLYYEWGNVDIVKVVVSSDAGLEEELIMDNEELLYN